MWTAIGTTVLKSVADAVLNKTQPNNNSSTGNHDGNYNIRGHINHMPVEVSINRGAASSSGNSSYRPPPIRSFDPQDSFGPSNHFVEHQNNSFTRTIPLKTQTSSSHNNGASNNSNKTKQKNPRGNNNDNKFVVVDKPKTVNTNNKPKNNDHTFCMVKMPSHGNFKIHIEKSGSDSSRMNNSNSANKKFNRGNNDNKQENKNRQFKHQNSNQKNNTRMSDGNKQSGNSNNRQNTWMYIGKLKIGTTESDLGSYLSIKFPKNQFKIQSLPLYKDGKLPCFKVLVDNAILSEFEQLGNWPMGVTIKKYQHNFKA